MASPVGDRDVLLLGSGQRAQNPLDADILLTLSAPLFKVDSGGNPLPSAITVSASLISLTGTVTFSATGATVTDNHNNTGSVAYSSLTRSNCSVTATLVSNGQTFTKSITINKVSDGVGTPGASGNQYATVQMYQWAAALPAKPNGTSGYTWATGVNSTYNGTDQWAVTVPINPGTANFKLYVATVQITAAGGTASTVVSYTNASVQAWTQNGDTGPSGAKNVAVRVYQWAASIPAAPAGSSTYTWATGALTSIPSGWTDVPGIAPSQGMTLWAAQVMLTDTATATQSPVAWTSSAILVAGSSGSNGAAGPSGASYVTAYCASATGATNTAPTQTTGKTSLPATNDGGIVGTWSATVPTLSTGQYLYQSDGIYDPTTNKVTWSIPYWSSLKVGNLSAITGNMGRLYVTDTISDTGNNWSIDATGKMVAKKFELQDDAANVILSAGQGLRAQYFAATVGGDNLCPNSSFEVATNGYLADGWVLYNNGTSVNEPATASIAYGGGRTGGNAQLVTWTVKNTTTKGVFLDHALRNWIPGATYIISFYAMTSNLSDTCSMFLAWNNSPAVVQQLLQPNLSANWQRYAFKITWGAAVESYGRFFVSITSTNSPGNVWFDDVMITEGDILPAYYPSAIEAGTTATWVNVTGSGKPQDNATVGAPSGTSVGGTEAGLLASRALNGDSAYNALPGINNAIADKISKTAASALQAPITLSTSGIILAGTTSNGVYMTPGGLFGVQNGNYTFSVPISGSPSFSGILAAGTVMSQNLSALSATIGTLRTASSGARIEISDNLIVGYRSNNTMSFKISA